MAHPFWCVRWFRFVGIAIRVLGGVLPEADQEPGITALDHTIRERPEQRNPTIDGPEGGKSFTMR